MRFPDEDIELQRLIQKIGVVSPKQAGTLESVGQTTINERVKAGEYESYLDGASRKITIRSILKRRERLLAAAVDTVSSRKPPRPRSRKSSQEIADQTVAETT
jgi:hypothetical protein